MVQFNSNLAQHGACQSQLIDSIFVYEEASAEIQIASVSVLASSQTEPIDQPRMQVVNSATRSAARQETTAGTLQPVTIPLTKVTEFHKLKEVKWDSNKNMRKDMNSS